MMGRRNLGACLHGTCEKIRDRRSSSYCTEHFEMREAKTAEAEERRKPASTTTTEEKP